MLNYIVKRTLLMIPTLIFISILSFFLIQLPPGDYLTNYIANKEASGGSVNLAEVEALRQRYGLDRPFHTQYVRWITGVLKGDFGYSFEWNRPVNELIWERLGLTVSVSTLTLLFTWIVAFPIGVYSATHQYSIGDYVFTTVGFMGLAIPNFMLALILMWLGHRYFGLSVGGLFSPEYAEAPWSLAKLLDLAKHALIPMIVIGTSGTASLIRTLRANLLDEIQKPYVTTAKSKGLKDTWILFKYPVRVALIPFISTVGWTLPQLISGETIVAVVLNLPTTGPLLLRSLQSQDMYLAGSFILMLSVLTLVGTFISDILLAWVDPRIRYS
ncbi:MAG: ABC transporter permease [Limnochordia bacterium]